jgi:hypothetical protein
MAARSGGPWWDGSEWRYSAGAPEDALHAAFDESGRPVVPLPGAVDVVRLVAALQGALGVVLGGATLQQWHAHASGDAAGDALLVVGALQIVFSLAVVTAGAYLGRLSESARVWLTCLEAVNAAAVLSQMLTPVVVISLLLDALVVLALWLPEVSTAMSAARTPLRGADGERQPVVHSSTVMANIRWSSHLPAMRR